MKKKISEKTSAKVPFPQRFGIGSRAGVAGSGPCIPIAVARPGPLLGQLSGLCCPFKTGVGKARALSVGFEVSLCPCLEARVFGNWEKEERVSKALGSGRGLGARSSPRVQPWGHHSQVPILGLGDEEL